jgi:enoyl-CoA hydratase/carnithine racemase
MQTISEGPVLVDRDGVTARIIFNRPEKKNAISNPMLRVVIRALEEAILDEEIRSILLIGHGDCFSSGRDIKEFDAGQAEGDSSLPSIPSLFMRALTLLLESPKPTVAAVRGFALGGGQAIALACDFLVAERTARFGNVEMAYGFPAAMNIALLSRHLGRRIALEIAITGELYSAERYWELGLINRLANPGELEAATDEFINVLTSREPWAVRRTKQTFRMAEQATEQGAMHLGDELNNLLFNGSRVNVHSGSGAAKDAIKKDFNS